MSPVKRPAHWLNRSDLCVWLQEQGHGTYDLSTIRDWEREDPPLPVAEKNGMGKTSWYDPEVVREWLEIRDATYRPGGERLDGGDALVIGDPTVPGSGSKDPRVRKDAWAAETARLNALRERGELIPASDLERALTGNVLAVKSALSDLPALLAARLRDLPHDEFVGVIRAECDAVLMRLAAGEGNPELQEAEEADDDDAGH